MRLGSTSYVYPADILPNAERLASIVDDIELVLFEVDDYGSNLPDEGTVARLNELAAQHDLTYTVHLPLDLRLADNGSAADASLEKAHKVIRCTQALHPWGYIVHLNGEVLEDNPSPETLSRWRDQAHRSLEIVCSWLDDPRRLCLENVERWDPAAFAPIVRDMPISRCIDIGHLWVQNVDPIDHLSAWIERTRVVHVHGVTDRDHRSLAHVPSERLDPIVDFLIHRYQGVITLEVFGETDFFSSKESWDAAVRRVLERRP